MEACGWLTWKKEASEQGLWCRKEGKRGARDLCSKREKKEKKQGVWKEQPTCYHTVFNNSVAATRGLHVHATAVQCLLSVCATHEKAPIQKSKRSALSVGSRLQGCRSSLCSRCSQASRVPRARLRPQERRSLDHAFKMRFLPKHLSRSLFLFMIS